jgi:RND superfamily putative drug exporter
MSASRAKPQRNLAASIGGWSAQHRKTAIIGWLLFVVLAVMVGNMVGAKELGSGDSGVGESGRAEKILQDAGIEEPAGEMILIRSDSLTADSPAFKDTVNDVIARVKATGAAEDPRSPYDTGAVSKDQKAVLVQYDIKGDPEKAGDHIDPLMKAAEDAKASHPGLHIEQFGDASGDKWFEDTIGKDFTRAEYTAVPLALGILLIAFGALVAALLPVVLAFTAFMAAGGLLALGSHALPNSDTTNSMMLLIGLAVGVDYCLFYIRREREERARGRDKDTALRIAAATSGRSVLISGITVIVAMAGMFMSGFADFKNMALGTILVVLTAVIGSLTVLPALLSLLGDKVDAGKIPGLHKRQKAALLNGSSFWNKVLGAVLRRPKASVVLAAGLLVALAVPAVGMKVSQLPLNKELPDDLSIVQTYDRIGENFPGGPSPAQVVVKAADVNAPAVQAAVEELKRQALASGQMSEPIEVVNYPGKSNVLSITIPLAGTGDDKVSETALKELRDKIIPNTLDKVEGVDAPVTGNTAGNLDFNDKLASTTPIVFAFVLAFAFILMLVSFRSITIAATAIVLNLLSVGAAYGVMTAVFQRGWGDSLVGTEAPGAIVTWIPMFLFVILFGLSMDYHVFVVSRIREAYDKGMDTKSAVAHGIKTTAGVVTSAAVIMVAVFGVFGTLTMQSMKQFGVGLAVAVLIDATIVRAVLLPAVMALLGDRNWYLPRWLGWLPQLSHGEEHDEPVKPAPRYEVGAFPAQTGYDDSYGHEPVSTSGRIPRPPVG